MLLIIYTDGDSGVKEPKNNIRCKPFLYEDSYEYAFIVSQNKINKFIEDWYNNTFELSDRVYETLNYIIPEVIYCLENNLEDKIENGNYYIKIIKESNFYLI